MGAAQVRSWVARGRLVRRHRGVYSLGHALLSLHGRWMAAVLACGDEAVLSHRTAAALWGLRPSTGGRIEVTVPLGGPRRPGDGIRTRESGIVAVRFATSAGGIPVTTPAWTLLDLGAVLRPHQLRRAVEHAERLELFDLRAYGVTLTRSDVEAMVLQICLDHALPRPQVNHYENSEEVDFTWPDQRLRVEVDGWSFHRSRRAFSDDRARDRRALQAGWRVARFPAHEVIGAPAAVAAELAALLAGGRL